MSLDNFLEDFWRNPEKQWGVGAAGGPRPPPLLKVRKSKVWTGPEGKSEPACGALKWTRKSQKSL